MKARKPKPVLLRDSERGIPMDHVLNNLVAYREELATRLEAVDKRIRILSLGIRVGSPRAPRT